MIRKLLILSLFLLVLFCKKKEIIVADADFQKKTMEALLKAKPDSIIELPEGKFQLDASLSLTVNRVKIKGKGIDKTILSFKGQTNGAEGILVTADDFSIEDLSIEDTVGDAIKIKGANGVTIRRVRTAWTGGPNEKNGAYGIYPVQCKNVLIEDSIASGASDSGIYVGQSTNIIVRRNKAEYNVAGIEIENSTYADVYENIATNNTGGILVFDLPDLPVQGGKNTRVFKNQVFNNNTDNFAPKGNIVGVVPPGTGILVLANDNIEIFENRIENHDTVNVGIVSYFITDKPINDPKYDPYPEAIYIHDNSITNAGENPRGLIVRLLALKLGKPFPDILYDGIVDTKKANKGDLPQDLRICLERNGDADFANIDAEHTFKNIDRDIQKYSCSHPKLNPVSINGIQ
ncbi:MAG TPA: parallel beta-helix domain-containing protein [Leptospiraceae bacterium]|nr:parallel beta-helix domain-containing protein [Leptospiraceae bacterium]HMW04521.1 parallel beta-helix domain-containing protein [Leptospiraceae bacterium]HMX31179.1 parallel beta-helix domain-containing protein [Leptospiraceae bacterium]HMY30707.1 parallel beta-helix domain-containing protein [Leptospiraceae bacterium]HMZ63224.1 parallel beta-helix domain-containing protein [Leptospiraceae bacterium]